MKKIQKYFLAIVPPDEISEKVQEIKFRIRDAFGVKYALKSPPHITVKMPFNYNEAKEDRIFQKLTDFLKNQEGFPLRISKTESFGNRVIYLGVSSSSSLENFQERLRLHLRIGLNLVEELSDRNYQPHLTVAFKDLKPNNFQEVFRLVRDSRVEGDFAVTQLSVLKRVNGIWIIYENIPFGGDF